LIEPGAVVRIALIVLAGWVTAVWICGAVYVAVSYVEAARFTPDRSLPEVLHAVLRESWLVLWTQPLLIWFQFFGRRLGSGGGVVPVVLVHGYFQNRVDFLYLARRLRAVGSGPLYACNFFWPQSLERSSANVARFVAQVCAETGATAVDLVTHSTGGLFALDLIAEQPHVVRRAALIALPARGVPWRGPVLGKSGSQLRTGSLYQTKRSTRVTGTPVVSIYSVHDNIVHPVQTSRLEGPSATNVEISGPGHLAVLFDRRVGDAVCDFLLGRRR
jgi:predicted alpha/beta hydrolase family esterase